MFTVDMAHGSFCSSDLLFLLLEYSFVQIVYFLSANGLARLCQLLNFIITTCSLILQRIIIIIDDCLLTN